MSSNVPGRFSLVGDPPVRLYGLLLADWQRRAWRRAGVGAAPGLVAASANWVLSARLARALASKPGAALVADSPEGRRLVAAHLTAMDKRAALEDLIRKPGATDDEITALGLVPHDAATLAAGAAWDLRKRAAPYAISFEHDGRDVAEAALFKSARTEPADVISTHLWRAPALAATRALAARRVAPGAVTGLRLSLGLLAAVCFLGGAWAPGFVFALATSFLTAVDGALARVTLTDTPLAVRLNRAVDFTLPPLWCLGWGLGVIGGGAVGDGAGAATATAALVGLLAGHGAIRAIEASFRAAHGFAIHRWRPWDSAFRLFAAGRNVTLLIFMVPCIVGAPLLGLVAAALWTLASAGLHGWRHAQAGFTRRTPRLAPWMAD